MNHKKRGTGAIITANTDSKVAVTVDKTPVASEAHHGHLCSACKS